MAEPITNLTALWVVGDSIKLSWDAASDATDGSVYELYVLKNQTYVETTYLKPVPYKVSGSNTYALNPPNTQFNYPWANVLALGTGGNAPGFVTFGITHVAADASESTMTTMTAYPAATGTPNVVPHLPNTLSFDPYGQMVTNDQDSHNEVAACVQMIIATSPGQRTAVPLFGLDNLDLAHSVVDPGAVEQSILEWEPRANVVVSVGYNNNNQAAVNVRLAP